jgi:hypothetical protein
MVPQGRVRIFDNLHVSGLQGRGSRVEVKFYYFALDTQLSTLHSNYICFPRD